MKIIMVKEVIGLGILVNVLHILAYRFFLYWTTDWYDIFMHFLGGLLIGLIIIAFIQRLHVDEEILNKKLLFITVILAVIAIGLSWELWEIFIGFTNVLKDQTDTIIDLVMDTLGGFFAIFYYYFKYSK